MIQQFGKAPSGMRLERIEQCDNYKNGSFQNAVPTSVNAENASTFSILKEMMNRPKSVNPSQKIPSVVTNLKRIDGHKPSFVWFGHSSYLLKVKDYTVLVDPVFSGNASPVSFFGKAYDGANEYTVEDMPQIDILLLTHDHYDHLDYPTIEKLKSKVKRIVCSLGVGSHLEYWGYSAAIITELNWWESVKIIDDFKITATPARHFSGRLFTRGNTLWSSFVFEIFGYVFYLGGDSGYSPQFKEIGDKFGSFDLAVMECGQYNENWPKIHNFPEEMVTAAKDLKAKKVIPVHWAKFTLATHPWNEPIKRFTKAANDQNLSYVSPKIGELYELNQKFEQEVWWDFE
ncbi:MBL fold metallo-hydrolase [Zunongwangia endophytica]|uniref:MBL fold metallo-hydrolase n=1 Tax=Zunongwangia endophytica TaxID=1808945 RepID=A0ABV8HAP1_9FLAO|nr:MBL fold metallo-hydrolase [Zunongwangia endophytica]MDN3593760.1 MBL fold metallo-hydrolase [Zunongwangia endophytica]